VNICVTSCSFYPAAGGVASHLLDLCRELLLHGHRVHALVGARRDRPCQDEIRGIRITRDPLLNAEARVCVQSERHGDTRPAPNARAAVRDLYQQFVEANGIEVLHAVNFHHFPSEYSAALGDLRLENASGLLTVHEVWSQCVAGGSFSPATWDLIVAPSEQARVRLRRERDLTGPVFRVYPGVNLERFSPENRNLRWAARLGLGVRPIILHPARMLPRKGVLDAVRALAIVHREFPDALLILTNDEESFDRCGEVGRHRSEVWEEIQRLDLDRNVVIQPFPHMQLPWLYNAADVVIYPSVGEEPFGLAPVEAMACARPVVVTPCGGMIETVVHQETGFIILPADPEALAERILLLLRETELAHRLGHAGRDRAIRCFSRARMGCEMDALYLAGYRRRRGETP
jgi:glycosyltransferase involved in cell wall biosynthesis